MRIEPRYFTMKLNFPRVKQDRQRFVNGLLGQHKMVVLMGMPGTGKSTLLSYYDGKPDWTLTKWDREPIFEMIFAGGERDEKYNSYVQTMEKKLFTDLLKKDYHQTVIDGWHRLPNSRTWLPAVNPYQGVALVVLDGPTEKIVERCSKMKKYKHMTRDDLTLWVEQLHETMVWPTFDEGFHSVFYVNTFGKEGAEYLNYRLINR